MCRLLDRVRPDVLALLIACLLLAGCSDDSKTPSDVSGVWMGSYATTAGDSGTAVLELVQDGAGLEGEISYRQWGSKNHDVVHFLKGSIHDDHITVQVDADTIEFPYQVVIDAEFTDLHQLAGTFSHSAAGISADFLFRRVPHFIAADTSFGLNVSVLAMAFDGDTLWISAGGDDDYLVGTLDSDMRRVTVYMYPGAHWTGSTLACDGNFMWSDYPVSFMHGDGTVTSVSDLVQFTHEGVIEHRYTLPHHTSGLAWDGEALWSLSSTGNLYQLSATGQVTDSLVTGFPDMHHLEYAMGHFWSVGWFIRNLYKIDRSGQVIAVYDLPPTPGFVFPAGLAFNGSQFYYASNGISSFTTFHRLSLGNAAPGTGGNAAALISR